jgi:transposase
MKEPLFVRSLTKSEHTSLRTGLRSTRAFTLCRSQILLLSAEGKAPGQSARHLGCTDQTVRNVIRAFATEGLGCLEQKSSRPKTAKPELDEAKCEQVRALLHHAPWQFGQARSTWSLPMVAEVCQERGLTKALVSDETIRNAIKRLGIRGKYRYGSAPAVGRHSNRGSIPFVLVP